MKHLKQKRNTLLVMALGMYSLSTVAQTISPVTPALVDFDAYEKLVAEVKEHRKTRLLNAEEFLKVSKEEKVIILDTRSDSMYKAVHVKGAFHLNFSDFTQDNLAKIIPSPDYKILIYCNNNFTSKLLPSTAQIKAPIIPDLSRYFVTKMAQPIERRVFVAPVKSSSKKQAKKTSGQALSNQLIKASVREKPLTLALNIPTYINLYGYGYKNVYELSELINTYEQKIEFEGTAMLLKIKN